MEATIIDHLIPRGQSLSRKMQNHHLEQLGLGGRNSPAIRGLSGDVKHYYCIERLQCLVGKLTRSPWSSCNSRGATYGTEPQQDSIIRDWYANYYRCHGQDAFCFFLANLFGSLARVTRTMEWELLRRPCDLKVIVNT